MDAVGEPPIPAFRSGCGRSWPASCARRASSESPSGGGGRPAHHPRSAPHRPGPHWEGVAADRQHLHSSSHISLDAQRGRVTSAAKGRADSRLPAWHRGRSAASARSSPSSSPTSSASRRAPSSSIPRTSRAILAPLPRAAARGDRALRRHGGEVHRRRGRWRSSARRWRTRTTPSGRCAPRCAIRGRGLRGRLASCRCGSRVNTGEALVTLGAGRGGEGMVAGDVVNTAARLQSAAPVERHPRRRGRRTARPAHDRVSRRRAGRGEGEGRAGAGLAGARGARPHRRDVGRARRRSSGASRNSTLLLRVRRALAADARPSSHDRRRPGHRQEPAGRRALHAASTRGARSISGAGTLASPTARASPSGRSARSSRRRRASSRPTPPTTPRRKLDDAVATACRRTTRLGRASGCGRWSGSSADGERAATADEAFAAWRRFLEALAEQRPLVLVFEDLHWADDDMLEFVDHLVDWVEDVPLARRRTARPELSKRDPAGEAASETR